MHTLGTFCCESKKQKKKADHGCGYLECLVLPTLGTDLQGVTLPLSKHLELCATNACAHSWMLRSKTCDWSEKLACALSVFGVGRCGAFTSLDLEMMQWVSQLETHLETENDFCEWDRLETWMPILGITWWISNVLPHVTKRRVNVMSTLRLHLHVLFRIVMSPRFYVWFMLRVIFPYIGFSMTYTWYIALLWRFATSVALVKVWFAPKVYLCKALIPFGVKTAECHGAPNL